MADAPRCRNAVKFSDHASDMRMVSELPDAWLFRCKVCGLVNAVSKAGVRDRSKFERESQRLREVHEAYRRRTSRPAWFT